MNVTQFRGHDLPQGTSKEMSWPELAEALSRPQPGNKNELPGWSPVTFINDRRLQENVQRVFAFVGDVDKGGISIDRLRAALKPWRAFIHSTSSATPAAPKWRFVIPLSRPIDKETFAQVWEMMRECFDAEGITLDPSACSDPSRFWYVPGNPKEGEFVHEHIDGEPFDVDSLPPRETMTRLVATPTGSGDAADTVLGAAFRAAGMLGAALPGGKRAVTCPWAHEHSDGRGDGKDSSTVIFPAMAGKKLGGFNCSHSHCIDRTYADVLAALPQQAVEQAKQAHPGRPTIRIGTELHTTVSEAVQAIGANVDIFQRGGQLVRVVRTENTARAPGSPSIRPVSAATLMEVLTKVATWERYDGRTKDWARCKPPTDVVAAVMDRGIWPGVRTLTGVVEAPCLRPDGTVLQGGGGHDAASGYMFIPNAEFPTVPDQPTKNDAVTAAARLFDVVVDFPFATEAHRSAWLAFLLTLFARPAIRGCVPLMAVDATTRGTGKGKLVSATSIIATGREVAITPCPEKDEELRKAITTLLSEGERLACLDNIASTLNYPSLDAALTSSVWKDRVLGRTQSVEIANDMVWSVTGNNLTFEADTARRTLHIRLESPLENPEDREDFKHRNLLEHVKRNRPALVRDVLTILRAFYVAGAPKVGCKPWGSFESWTRVVANCVTWLDLPDPQTTRAELVDADVGKSALVGLVVGLERLITGDGMSAKTIIATLYTPQQGAPDGYDDLREAIEHFAPSFNGKPPNPQKLGYALRRAKKRVIAGRRIEALGSTGGTIRWGIQKTRGDSRDSGDAAMLRGQDGCMF